MGTRSASVCLSSVCTLVPSWALLAGWNFRQCFYAIWYLGHPLITTEKFYGDRPRGTPPSAGGGSNTRGIAKYSDFGPIEGYTMSQKTSHLWLAITLAHMNGFWYFFGRNVTDKAGNQKTLYYATSNNLCFCTTWQNAETRKAHISLNWIVLHTQCACALSCWKKKMLSVTSLIASNICWDSKVSQ